ncbi:MAG: hypothetical protein ACUVTD_08680, partial [Nitrososphaerales archaeon]
MMTAKELLEDSELQAWYSLLSLRSRETAKSYLRVLSMLKREGFSLAKEEVPEIRDWLLKKF